MLTELSTIKSRLAIEDLNVQFDDLLTTSIEAISARFDKETNRTLARTVDATFEFDTDDLEISVPVSPSNLSRIRVQNHRSRRLYRTNRS